MILTPERQLGLRDPRLLRSVHLERDWNDASDPSSFILGSAAADVIEQILTAINPNGIQSTGRTFTITGPYGTGKSALALFTSELLCGNEQRRVGAEKYLMDFISNPDVEFDLTVPFLPVLITCSGQSLSSLITGALHRAFVFMELAVKGDVTDPLRLLAELSKAATKSGYAGVFLVLDELGKALEFAARHPEQSDIYVLQQLAEQANRSKVPVCVLGILHQAFGDYVDEFDQGTKTEWAKVQGRFTDIAYLPSEVTLARLISDSIACEDVPAPARRLFESIAKNICQIEGIWPSSLEPGAFVDMCLCAYPLHPTVLTVLPVLMRRLGQNERSVFAFLAERGLLTERGDNDLIRLDSVFDHMVDWVGFGLRRSSGARFWRLACEILDSRSGMRAEDIQAVKTIGLLMSVSSSTRLNPSSLVLSLALNDCVKPTEELQRSLEDLRRRSIITYRRHLDSFVLWQGSDIDLDAEIERGRKETHGRVGLASSLSSIAPLPNLIARRHSFETGTLRWFAPVYVDDPNDLRIPTSPVGGANGFFAVCLGATPSAQEDFELAAMVSERTDVIFAISHRIPHLKSLLDELIAMNWVDANVAGLRDDRIAREELAFQRVNLTAQIRREVGWLTDPKGNRGDGCIFWCAGASLPVLLRRDVSRQLSDQFDKVFSSSLLVRNELINRRELSSAAAAARRNLIEGMIERSHLPRLGIEGFPPERAIYESVLLQSGLHVKGGDDTWKFNGPTENDPCRVRPVWNFIAEQLFDRFPHPVSVKTLMSETERPPYGVVQGLFPLVLCAFLIVHHEEATLYREGSFIPNPSIVHWELMLRRPDLFEVGGCRHSGTRKQVIVKLCERLGIKEPSLLPVVRFLVRSVEALPPRARNSKKLSSRALKLRDTILDARSPEALLFHDAPIALDLLPLDDAQSVPAAADKFVDRLKASLYELSNLVQETRAWARHELARSAGLAANDVGWDELRHIALDLSLEIRDPRTREFCNRLSVQDLEQAEIGAISLVAMRPVESWSDSDLRLFPDQAATMTKEIRSEVVRNGMNADPTRREQARRAEETLEANVTALIAEGNDRMLLQGVLRRLLRHLERDGNE